MTVRLTHRQKPDTQNYIFQALGSPFSLTGIAASLRTGFRMSVPDKIPYIYTGYSASVSKLPPVWGTLPAYSVAATTPMSAQALPVSVPGGGSPTITVAWHSSSVPSTQPTWVRLTSGTTPTIEFTGDANQVDAADVASMVLSAMANGNSPVLSSAGSITVTAVLAAGINIAYTANEGYSTVDGTEGGFSQRLVRGQVAYESAFATKDGTLIEAFDGAHGRVPGGPGVVRGTSNRVGEWSPATRGMAEVYPENWEDHGAFGYDNLIYCYFDAIDSLVVFRHGVYSRAVTDTMVNRLWNNGVPSDSSSAVWTPSSVSNSGTSAWTHRQDAGTESRFPRGSGDVPPPSGRPPVWSSNVTQSPAPLIYVPAARSSQFAQHVEYYNVHCAYSKQFDCAIIIGGGPNVQDPGQSAGSVNIYVTTFVPSNLVGTYSARYYANNRSYSRSEVQIASEVGWATGSGRAGIKFLGHYVYWGGGFWNSNKVPYFWRADIRPILANPTADLGTTFVPERLADIPGGGCGQGMMAADPYSNSIVCVGKQGVSVYDATANTWSDITSQCTDYAAYWTPGNYPWYMCGDFIDTVASSGSMPRKTYWYGGHDFSYPLGPGYSERFNKVRSVKVSRGNTILYLNVTSENPENTSQNWSTNITENPKHQGLLVTGTSSNRRLYMMSGDFEGYPSTLGTTGYKNEPGTFSGSGRQDVWAADISDSAIASSSVRFKMVSNGYAYYPWTGSQGYYNSATKGPRAMDALGSVIDKRGQIWLGPCDNNDYVDAFPEYRGQSLTYAAMYKWTQPGTNSTATTGAGVNGVALGNAWTLPNQDKLYNPTYDGVNGVDYTISSSGASDIHGWGRTNARGSVYDSVNDKIYTISIGLNSSTSPKTFSIKLYGFSCVPDGGGVHRWTTTTVTKNIRDFGGPPDIEYSNLGTYGDNKKGGINCAPELIGRRMYFVAMWGYSSPTGNLAATPLRRGYHTRAVLLSMNIDNPSDLEWIPFPQSQNWWCRMFDGPYAYESGQIGLPNNSAPCSTPAQQRGLTCVGTKVVLGPDCWTKIGVDPFLQVYDTVNKSWTSFAPPTTHDYPNTLDALVGVPELGEAWLVGSQALSTSDDAYPFVSANNIHIPPSNAGRRIVRFKVTDAVTPSGTYSTSFDSTENPISEGGNWAKAATNHIAVLTTGGVARTAALNQQTGHYDDAYSILTSWTGGTDYEVTATVSKTGSQANYEVELLLRCTDGASTIQCYECLFNVMTPSAQLMKWNGPLDSFTEMAYSGGLGPPASVGDGDLIRATIVGSTISFYHAPAATPTTWRLMRQTTAATEYATGKPGIAFWVTSGDVTLAGFKDFQVEPL